MANVSMYHDGMRRLQDARETRPLADRLEQVTVRTALTEEDRAFIARCPMFFLATADADGPSGLFLQRWAARIRACPRCHHARHSRL